MSTPLLGRNARLYKDGIVIGHGKNISVKGAAELIKDYDMDSLNPAIVAPGKQTFKWTAEKFYLNGSWMTLLLTGTSFDIVFQPAGTYKTAPYEEWTGCVVLNVERTAGEAGGIIEKIDGEGTAVSVHDS
jgi:hypothetical protein